MEPASSRRLYPREERIGPGAHEVERIDNPFVPGGEAWLVLKGSHIGAAEAYIKRLVASTRGTSTAVELATDTEPATPWPAPQKSAA